MLKVGENLAGYEIVAKLNSGGMASLFLGRRARAAGFAKYVAIKVVHTHLAEDDSFIEMFLDEARLSAKIEHPNVVHVEDLGEFEGNYFMVMEYIAGASLGQLLRALAKRKLRLAPEVAVAIASKLASALHAAHELTSNDGQNLGVVHRDVSPQNVILAFKGHIKLIDFGIAKAADRTNQTQGSVFKGKIRYAAPEQAMGKPLDRRADLFALGILLWEMLTSHRLFDGETDFEILEQVRNPTIRPPSFVVGGIPASVDEVVLKALSKDPALRPQTGEEFRQMLVAAMPQSLAIDSQHIADLLSVMAQDVIEAEAKKLGGLSTITQLMGVNAGVHQSQGMAEKMVAPITKAGAKMPAPPTPSKPNIPVPKLGPEGALAAPEFKLELDAAPARKPDLSSSEPNPFALAPAAAPSRAAESPSASSADAADGQPSWMPTSPGRMLEELEKGAPPVARPEPRAMPPIAAPEIALDFDLPPPKAKAAPRPQESFGDNIQMERNEPAPNRVRVQTPVAQVDARQQQAPHSMSFTAAGEGINSSSPWTRYRATLAIIAFVVLAGLAFLWALSIFKNKEGGYDPDQLDSENAQSDIHFENSRIDPRV